MQDGHKKKLAQIFYCIQYAKVERAHFVVHEWSEEAKLGPEKVPDGMGMWQSIVQCKIENYAKTGKREDGRKVSYSLAGRISDIIF